MWGFLPVLLQGLLVTVEIAAMSALLAVIAAFAAGFAKMSKVAWLRWCAAIYIEIFRGTSALVQLFWLYFVLPHFGITLTAMAVGVLGLGLNIGAYGAEVVRCAVESVPKRQLEAATALNLSRWQTLRFIVLPQAFLVMLPPWTNLLIELLKATALVSLITLGDLTFKAYQLNQATFRTIEIFTLVLALYFVVAMAIAGIGRGLERRFGRHRKKEA